MVKIHPLGPRELKQVLTLLEQFTDDEFNYPVLERYQSLFLPFHQMSHWLPLKLTFLPGIYVAVEQKKVLGLVWVSQDGGNSHRWKIDQLILDPHNTSGMGPGALDVGRQLIDYVINAYGAKGVETFLAYVDSHYDQGLALLKECGFRHCARLTQYQSSGALTETIQELVQSHANNHLLREARPSDRGKLTELYAETLPPEVRTSLRKTGKDLFPGWNQRLGQAFRSGLYKHWVLGEAEKVYLMGSVVNQSTDFKHFTLSLIVSPGWQDGLYSLLAVALRHIYSTSSQPTITTQIYEFHQETGKTMAKLGFSPSFTTQVLVKDYWVSNSKAQELIQNPVLLFTNRGTSPAWQPE